MEFIVHFCVDISSRFSHFIDPVIYSLIFPSLLITAFDEYEVTGFALRLHHTYIRPRDEL